MFRYELDELEPDRRSRAAPAPDDANGRRPVARAGARGADRGTDALPRWLLVVPRLYLGAVFAAAGAGKLAGTAAWTGGQADWPSHLARTLEVWLPNSPALYAGLIRSVVLPNIEVLGAAIAWTELLIGAALLLGAATRLTAAAAALLLANYVAASGAWSLGPGAQPALAALALAVLLGAAGRSWGIDQILARRWPEVPLW